MPESSELLAGIAGTQTVTRETERVTGATIFGHTKTGDLSLRSSEAYVVHPNTFKSLKRGECIAIEKYPRSRAGLIKIDPPIVVRVASRPATKMLPIHAVEPDPVTEDHF